MNSRYRKMSALTIKCIVWTESTYRVLQARRWYLPLPVSTGNDPFILEMCQITSILLDFLKQNPCFHPKMSYKIEQPHYKLGIMFYILNLKGFYRTFWYWKQEFRKKNQPNILNLHKKNLFVMIDHFRLQPNRWEYGHSKRFNSLCFFLSKKFHPIWWRMVVDTR